MNNIPTKLLHVAGVGCITRRFGGVFTRTRDMERTARTPHLRSCLSLAIPGLQKSQFLRGTPILPVQRAETPLGGGCHPRTTCMTIKNGPTHTRRLGSKTPRCPFTGAQDPSHIFYFWETNSFFFFKDLREGASRPQCCLLRTRRCPAKDSDPLTVQIFPTCKFVIADGQRFQYSSARTLTTKHYLVYFPFHNC